MRILGRRYSTLSIQSASYGNCYLRGIPPKVVQVFVLKSMIPLSLLLNSLRGPLPGELLSQCSRSSLKTLDRWLPSLSNATLRHNYATLGVGKGMESGPHTFTSYLL